MELLLLRTWEEIAELISHSNNALLVLQLINQVSHRNWHFETTFDSHNHNNLYIASDPPLELHEFKGIVNGVVTEIFNCNSIIFCSSAENTIGADIAHYRTTTPLNNILEFTTRTNRHSRGIYLDGFWGTIQPPEMGNPNKVEETIRKYTWFATNKYAHYHHKLTWECGATSKDFVAEDWHSLTTRLFPNSERFSHEQQVNFGSDNTGNVRFETFSGLIENKLFHGKFGEMDLTQVYPEFWTLLRDKTKSNWNIEFDEQTLRVRYHQELTPYASVMAVLLKITEVIIGTAELNNFKQYREKLLLLEKTRSATNLSMRQLAATKRPKVMWQGKELMCEPEGETEVVCLLAKLETIKHALPVAHFSLLEYTPNAGIDALANYQISNVYKSEVLSPVELEFKFENFFKHDHPLEQVSMIICWKMRTPLDQNLTSIKAGLYQYRSEVNHIWVIVIRDILGIEVLQQ